MDRSIFRHGCRPTVWLLGLCSTAAGFGEQPVPVRTRVFDLEYVVNETALPLESVQLWYKTGREGPWHQYGPDPDRQSPVSFHAPAEGLYGFYVVVTNATGPSSLPPTPDREAHRWAFVDYTPPIVQLHPPRITNIVGRRTVQVRWTALDAHLVPRPIEIAYRRLPSGSWSPATPDPLSNTGRFDWRLPDELTGSLEVRVSVLDKAGNRSESKPRVIEVPAAPPEDEGLADARGRLPGQPVPVAGANPRTQARVDRLLEEARRDRERGSLRQAIARMREAVKADPSRTDAFAEMAAMLYRVGDFDRALEAYEIVLQQHPGTRSALRGAAMVHRQSKNYGKAAEMLQTVLRHRPKDAETWLNLGDVAVFQGDEIRARECYEHAIRIDPSATQVITDARRRLELMEEVSRTYRSSKR